MSRAVAEAISKGLILLLFFLAASCARAPSTPSDSNPWAAVKKPLALTPGKTEVFGFYSLGCISGAAELPVSGPFWEFVNAGRNRYYAHPNAADFLERLGTWAFVHGKLLLGDIAQPAGGPTSSGHASHQQGLDIDVRFGFAPAYLTSEIREGYPQMAVAMHFMEAKDGKFRLVNEMTPDWNDVYGETLMTAALDDKVDRIFVSPPIKKTICDKFRRSNSRGGFNYPDWLRRIRPYYEHNAHFHVRLYCPDGNPLCEPQKPNPVDPTDSSLVGCSGNEFGWWFESDPARPGYLKDSIDEHIKRGGAPAPSTTNDWAGKHAKLPPACHELLKLNN